VEENAESAAAESVAAPFDSVDGGVDVAAAGVVG